MKNFLKQFLIIGLLPIVVFACDKTRVFEKYSDLPREGWHKNDPVVFEVAINDSVQKHNLYLNVRNDINYRYSNLWLFVENQRPNGTAKVDTFEVLLAEPSGKWLGEGFGGKKVVQSSYKQSIQFPVTGTYIISIYQGMRDETLEGINDIGFRVETAK